MKLRRAVDDLKAAIEAISPSDALSSDERAAIWAQLAREDADTRPLSVRYGELSDDELHARRADVERASKIMREAFEDEGALRLHVEAIDAVLAARCASAGKEHHHAP